MIYLCDLDGTTFSCEHRLHFISGENKQWDSFFAACVDDTPIMPVVETIRALKRSEATILAVTGRSDQVRKETIASMLKYGVPYDRLYMRKQGDHRPDFVVKAELLEEIREDFPGQTIVGAFEDRKQVVDMYRSKGITVFQVADGAY